MNPTPEAIALAVKLSGHIMCQRYPSSQCIAPCGGCLADAETIDRELKLPQCNAALLLAQAVVEDACEFGTPPERSDRPYVVRFDVMEELREALAAIQK